MEVLLGIAIAVGAFVWYGRHVTFQSCRAHAFLTILEKSGDVDKANIAAAALTWRMCLMINEEMNLHASLLGGQPIMRKMAKQFGWLG